MAINLSDITFTWQFNPLVTFPTSSGYTDVVFKAFYQLTAATGSIDVTAGGFQEILPLSPSSSFIPFDNLTSPVMQQWVEDAIGEEGIANLKNDLAEKLEYKINPPTVTKRSPWIAP